MPNAPALLHDGDTMPALRALSFVGLILLPSLIGRAATPSPDPGERAAVLAVVQKFFDAMTARDVAASRATLLPDGQWHIVRNDPAGVSLRRRTHEEYLARMPESKELLVERTWDATVMVHDRIAMVWAPYDFHRDGKFSHGGIDLFTLVRTGDGWKIATLVFTIEPNPTAKNPAGPLPATSAK